MAGTGRRARGVVRRLLSGRAPWTPVACAVYLANVLVGTASLRRHRLPRRPRPPVHPDVRDDGARRRLLLPRHRARGVALLGALAPLALLPRFGTHARRRPRRHVLIASSAAPFYLAALALWVRSVRSDPTPRR
ncbi:hypothetical protein NBM05_09375 [Rothia sp. AR01]|uniref:Uncharacterized protein n=1 Tax=Rothia santali TaxID=2949643 RepID=A0A9X2HI98_9MICC|nr:hypothetical protein [Rothia santali]MCP3426211.1 hypothetical protein [Rothia santali]